MAVDHRGLSIGIALFTNPGHVANEHLMTGPAAFKGCQGVTSER